MPDLLFNPVSTFLIILVLVALLYVGAGKLGPKYKTAKYKLESYACGEHDPEAGGKRQHSYGFFHVAFFFTVLHVGALLLATAPQGASIFLGIILIGTMAVTAVALYLGRK